MKITSLLLGLLLCSVARADSVTLAGTIKESGEKIVYSFTVSETDFPTFAADLLNGTVRITGSGPQQNLVWQNDLFEFGYGDTVTLAQFANWELIAQAGLQISLVDPPIGSTATPEASTFAYAIIGIFGLAILWTIRRKLL